MSQEVNDDAVQGILSRLLEFIEAQGISLLAFERRCGNPHGNLPKMKKGPSAAYFAKIVAAFPELNMNWLFSGKGDMLNKEQPVPAPKYDIHHNGTVSVSEIQKENAELKDERRRLLSIIEKLASK